MREREEGRYGEGEGGGKVGEGKGRGKVWGGGMGWEGR